MTGSEVRAKFLQFFEEKGHRKVHSSPLVPHNDPTLLFTNAGMNQFKDVFLGLEKRDYNRATSSQKCVRAGGKHNDLENVGFTNRHHTFFEMLGNFSFGDYFKKDAIAYAWELITSEKWFGIAKDKLYVTIFNGEGGVPRDVEAHELWAAQGVAKDRIFEMGLKDNFWQMGDTGPCGPCSEIHYDMGVAASDQGHTDCAFGCDCGRYVEIWNLVFMQFDRDASGKLNPLPKPSIDTGAGLERVTAVLQGVISNYDTDLFAPLIERAKQLLEMRVVEEVQEAVRLLQNKESAASLRVIADHARSATFLISDGVLPTNEGRGYVLRKIIRRAITHGRLLGQTKPFLHTMVFAVRDLMQDAYPELKETVERVSKTVQAEEKRFANTLDLGLSRLELDLTAAIAESRLAENPATARQQAEVMFGRELGKVAAGEIASSFSREAVYAGEKAFKLYDTYGMPIDFIQDAARDRGVNFDQAGFDRALTEQRERARASWKGTAKQSVSAAYQQIPPTIRTLATLHAIEATLRNRITELLIEMHSVGTLTKDETARLLTEIATQATSSKTFTKSLEEIVDSSASHTLRQELSKILQNPLQEGALVSKVVAIVINGANVESAKPNQRAEVFLDRTPFYAESGGQVGDSGWLLDPSTNGVRAEVEDCYFPVQGVRAHKVYAKTSVTLGDIVIPKINEERRQSTMRNHTATHLLQAGLREVLGKHVKQAGSLVAPNHLRFDFSHFTGVADEELQDIEDIINKEVLRNEKVEVIENVPIDVAINEYHAMALFGEKYGDKVRVIKIGDFSTELCGGTHTGATGEIGLIKILKEGSVSSGVRRVEAITGEGSLHHFRKDHQLENVVASFVGPTLSQKTRKDGAPKSSGALASEETPLTPAEALKAELEKKDAEIKRLVRELDQARMKSASSSTANIGEKIKDVKGVKVLAHRVDNLERGQMRTLVDQLRDKVGSGVVVLGSATDGNVSLIVGVTKDLTAKVQAGKIIGPVAQKVGGKGGGRPDLAEAGGKDLGALDAALGEVYEVVGNLLS
jgi:alanyl-tRNA synthetase